MQTKEKTRKVIYEVKIPPFPHHTSMKVGVCTAESDHCCVAPLLFPCFPHGERECWLLWTRERISHLKLFRGQCNLWAVFQRLWALYKNLYHTASSILFVSRISPSAILITSTVHIWLQFQAVMLQGCPQKVTKPQLPLVIRKNLSCQPFSREEEMQKVKFCQGRYLNTLKTPKFLSKRWSNRKISKAGNCKQLFLFCLILFFFLCNCNRNFCKISAL